MLRIILDTNVVVSSLIQKSYPYLIVDHLVEGKMTLCLSDAILSEYIEVLNRPKFARFTDFKLNAEQFITRVSLDAEFYLPQKRLDLIKDEADNRFLELAEVSRADFLITGNIRDFTMKEYQRTKIVQPNEFWNNFL